MASTINASSTANGIVSTADASGILKVQSNGVTTNAVAWVNWGVSGTTVTVNNSYNVTSVTRVGTGDYTVNFTNAMPNANYVVSGTCQTTVSYAIAFGIKYNVAPTTTSCELYTFTVTTAALVDSTLYGLVFFGS